MTSSYDPLAAGRVLPELGREDVRELPLGADRLIYRLTDEAVLVLTVRHGARRWDDGEVGSRTEDLADSS